MQIYLSRSREEAKNTSYPYLREIGTTTKAEELEQIFSKDYVTATYKDNKRSNDSFISSDCLALDCDNDHSEDPNSWITPQDVMNFFPGVFIVFHMSRNHMKQKGDKAPRPRFHSLFLIRKVMDKKYYSELKKRVNACFPYFDKNALDAGRFFFGSEHPEVVVSKGINTLDEYFEEEEFANYNNRAIPEGQRNKTMLAFASKVLFRYGDSTEAEQLFYERSNDCVPALEDAELKTIYKNAQRFYKNKVLTNPDYKKPEDFNAIKAGAYKPSDYTDVAQAQKFAEFYKDKIAYNDATHYLVYKDGYWQSIEALARGLAHEFTDKQLLDSRKLVSETRGKLTSQLIDKLSVHGKNKVMEHLTEDEKKAYREYLDALEYEKFALNRRNSNYISALLKEIIPHIYRDIKEFDANPFLIATPQGTINLKEGIESLRPNDPKDYISKMTLVGPSEEGKDKFLKCLNDIFSNDQELIDYVQEICGLAAVGKVYVEGIIIAHGEGGNGKSTFWNTILKVFGSYGGTLSSDNLFVNNRRNVKFEIAELRGKRIIIASENEQGSRLDDGALKKLCSTDMLKGEHKFKSEFNFAPSHTLILYINHLPKLFSRDDGTWRRIKIIPFLHKFQGKEDILNYSDVLVEESGGYILTWIIEGAKKVIEKRFKLETPKAVKEASDSYKESNDWFKRFIDERADLSDPNAEEGAGTLYETYKKYALTNNEYVQPLSEFKGSLEKLNLKVVNRHNKKFYKGIKLQDEIDDEFLK